MKVETKKEEKRELRKIKFEPRWMTTSSSIDGNRKESTEGYTQRKKKKQKA